MGLVAWGEQTVPSGIAGVLIAMMPVWVAILGRIVFRERLPGRRPSSGSPSGMRRASSSSSARASRSTASLDPAGVAALILSPMAWAAGSLFSAHGARLPRDPFLTTGLQMLCGGLVLAVDRGRDRRARGRSTRRRSRRSRSSRSSTSSRWAAWSRSPRIAWVLRHAPAAARRHVRLREPGDRGLPRLADPRRERVAGPARRGRRSSSRASP